MFGSTYSGRRILITGHTGFKGSWLSLWLQRLGASVTGYALAPLTEPSLYELSEFSGDSVIGDIRDQHNFAKHLERSQPEIVFHLAAQPSVLVSYADPLETFSTNVMGTANVLEACRQCASVKAVIVVTTDKCYENQEWLWGYRENDTLGGRDPYSASKACAELVAQSYRRSFCSGTDTQGQPTLLVATARAGNVIGGGDWTSDRLVPDIMRAAALEIPVQIRNPASSRPWQHVLDCLCGYLLLGQGLLKGQVELAEAWNFGPDLDGNLGVGEVAQLISNHWPQSTTLYPDVTDKPHEANLLMVDSTKARTKLKWQPVWDIQTTLMHTTHWYRAYYEEGNLITQHQIQAYEQSAAQAGAEWAIC
ncbi:MAG: CDP-glucose 4,6-dehydratase [Motiliproteus sp.]|jgi:CDP-glucose 4,6-dehydratase